MRLIGAKEKPLVLDDRPSKRTAKLISNKSILQPCGIREGVVGGQRLHAIVFEQRTMELVRAGFEHSVGNESTALAVFSGIAVGDDPIFLNRFRRD